MRQKQQTVKSCPIFWNSLQYLMVKYLFFFSRTTSCPSSCQSGGGATDSSWWKRWWDSSWGAQRNHHRPGLRSHPKTCKEGCIIFSFLISNLWYESEKEDCWLIAQIGWYQRSRSSGNVFTLDMYWHLVDRMRKQESVRSDSLTHSPINTGLCTTELVWSCSSLTCCTFSKKVPLLCLLLLVEIVVLVFCRHIFLKVYFASQRTIERIDFYGGSREVLVSEDVDAPEGLAIDWVHRRMYWTDARYVMRQSCFSYDFPKWQD